MSLVNSRELPANCHPGSNNLQEASVCRVCNVSSSNCLPLFKQHFIGGKITTLAKVLVYCTGLEILEAEHYLPQHICSGCMVKMQSSLQFKRSVHRMDRLLRQRHLDFGPQKTNQSLKNASPKASNGEKATEELIFVLDEQDDSKEQQHLEIEIQKLKESQTDHKDGGQPIERTLGIRLKKEDPQRVKQEMQQVDSQEERENRAKNWIQVTEEHLEAELNEDDLYEIVDEPEDPEEPEEPEEPENPEEQENPEEPLLVVDLVPKQSKAAITRSQRRKTQNPTLQCQICGKQLSTSNSFKYHMQLHGTATPYVCQICGESFKTRNAHDGHVTLHDPNNPNSCSTCGKVYRQASSLRSHLLTHSGIKPFQCTICGKRLTQKSGYKKHMLTHTGEKPHGCDICGRSFRYSSNLIAHKRCHSQEKPHQCQVCHKRSFGSTSELNRHMLVHSSERPFACSECGKSFKRQVSLGLHQQSHKPGRNKWGKGVVQAVQEDHEET